MIRQMHWIALVALVVAACGSDGGSDPYGDYEPAVPETLPEPDESTYEVTYEDGVIEGTEEAVLADVENLQPQDGVFRIAAGSSLLEGVSEGSLVVWPQLGIFEITSMTDEGDRVAVGTRWARFSDAMSSADIQFTHRLRQMGPGSVFGVAPGGATGSSSDGLVGTVAQPIFDTAGMLEFRDDGIAYSADSWSVELSMMGEEADFLFKSSNSTFATELDAKVSGVSAEGSIQIDPEDPESEPTARIHFPNLSITGTAKVKFERASGDAEVLPPVQMVFPFMLGPVPAFVAISTRVAVQSTLSATATMEASATFEMDGTVTLIRDGATGVDIEGGITRFEQTDFSVDFDTSFTAGVSIDFDAPRVSFGLGRPGIATAAVYATHSAEALANVELMGDGDYCASVSTGSTVLYGGELTALGWSYGTENMLGGLRAPAMSRGPGCM
jgi:hypothetical protein